MRNSLLTGLIRRRLEARQRYSKNNSENVTRPRLVMNKKGRSRSTPRNRTVKKNRVKRLRRKSSQIKKHKASHANVKRRLSKSIIH